MIHIGHSIQHTLNCPYNHIWPNDKLMYMCLLYNVSASSIAKGIGRSAQTEVSRKGAKKDASD